MKFSPAVLAALPLAAAAPQPDERLNEVEKRAGLPYYLEFHYSNNFVKVGTADLFAAIWQKGFASGDSTGIETDDSYDVFGYRLRCLMSGDNPDLKVGVKMEGEWGVVSGVPSMAVRNQLIISMWDMVLKIQEEDDVVYKDCRDCGLGGCSDDPTAVCGAFRADMCDCEKNFGGGDEAGALCFDKQTTWKIPTEMTLALYNQDGSLRADSLHVSITSAEIAQTAQKCGKLGAAAEVILSIIPEFGKYISDQTKDTQRQKYTTAPAPDPDPVTSVDMPVIIAPTELVTIVEGSAEAKTPLSTLPVVLPPALSAAATKLTIEV